ncbi:hypothetical protein H4S02_004331 [Coemansia sp. RSA 2611]|nr:hypothetical protein H4S01_004345 [Coemansia sp. RSA 2610]KAJ2385430.1 hypothetical protein H4S02_004331 [Coemansia sp. RSA 2611]
MAQSTETAAQQLADDSTATESPDADTKKISVQEEDDLSSALIAQLLAEDGASNYPSYYDDYGNAAAYGDADDYGSGSSADDDWDPNNKRRRKSKGAKPRKHRRGADPASAEPADASSSDSDQPRRPKKSRAAAKKEKEKPAPVSPGQYRTGAYTDEEELKFNEGLELFGRSWSEISAHVVTRDPKSIRSHAQKYFIKLFRDQVPLPAKVRESGEGYTLSGRPLDPNSAAARPYLQHVMQLDPPAPKPPKPQKAAAAEDPAAEPEAPAPEAASGSPDSQPAAEAPAPSDSSASAPEVPPDAKPPAAPSAEPEAAPPPKPAERTEYAKSRPQRSQARPVALSYKDPHQMVRCTPFAGQPLSNVAGSQPFRLVVHTNAQLQMDLHAHLMLSEVIGLLGGRWDAQERVLTVARAFPCQALDTDDAHTNVEMDPGSELVVRHQIVDAGLRVVGWYHSHPTFRPDPSIIDIENQTAYQTLFRDNDSAEEPFVGAIVAPYDLELPGSVSVFNWFYVGRSAIDRGHPKRLAIETVPDCSLPELEQDILLHLLDSAPSLNHCAPLEEAWRPSSTELRALKMVVSLAHRMPWLSADPEGSDPVTPAVVPRDESADSTDHAPVSADSASDCTVVTDPSQPKPDAADKQIQPVHMRAGQMATRDPFLAALCRRFSAGVFKPDAAGEIANPQALAHIFAAHFMRWASA